MELKHILHISLLLLFVIHSSWTATHQGCYKEDKRRRGFNTSPGDYDPESMSPGICAGKCGAFSNFKYCAVTQGKFCFCGNTLPVPSNLDAGGTGCSTACSGDSGISCGGPNHINVYTTSPSILGLNLDASPLGAVKTLDSISFSASLTSGADNLEYQFDYDDGSGRTNKNATDMWSRAYPVPGQYQVTVFARDQAATLIEKKAVKAVMVESPVSDVVLTCPTYMATYEEANCEVTILQGTSMRMYNYINGTSVIAGGSMAVADPLIFSIGTPVQSKAPGSPGEITTDTIIMPASEFQQTGRVIGFEFYAEVSGSVQFLILQPSCGGLEYCFDTNTCETPGTCIGVFERQCSAGLEFCPSARSCWNSGTSTCSGSPTRYDGTQKTNLNQVYSVTYNIPNVGYQYYALDLAVHDLQVTYGYILGYVPVSGRIASTASSAAMSDLKTTNIANSGSAITVSKRHMLRAITSTGSKIKIPYKFSVPGSAVIDVNITNTRLPFYVFASKTVQVVEGINMAIPNLPVYAKTGASVTFQLLPHTGTSVNYLWTFGDGTDVNTTSSSYSKSYSTRGTYNVNITAYNQESVKQNTTSIVVQDEILGLSITGSLAVVDEVTQIGFSLTSGSDFTCDWSFVVGSTTDNTQTSWPSADNGIPMNYTFTQEGTYTVSVTCSNGVSSQQTSTSIIAQRKITGFQLEKTGAVKDQAYYIVFTWTAGTSPSFTLTFNGNPCTIALDLSNRRGQCGQYPAESTVQSYPLNLTATNLVSSEKIDVMFGIEVPMENVLIWSNASIDPTLGYALIARDDFLYFSVNMTTGTNVVVNWNYGDGNTDSYTVTNPLGWQSGDTETRIYQFPSLQFYDVVVTASNAYSSVSQTYRVLAIAPVENLAVSNVATVLFQPPSIVSFTFTQSSGLPPNEATMVINYGDSKTETIYPFDLSTTYSHTYREDGVFSITINISNIVSSQILTSTVNVVEKLDTLEIVPNPAHAPRGDPVDVLVKLKRGGTGTGYTLGWNMGDGTTVAPRTRTGISPDGTDVEVHTYTNVGMYTITVDAASALETLSGTYIIYCQNKVTADVVLTSNHPQDFTSSGGTVQLNVQYNGNPLPTDAYYQLDQGDGAGFSAPQLLSTHINTVGGSKMFMLTYPTDGHYVTSFRIYNKVSNHTFEVPTGLYNPFVGLAVTPKYQKFPPVVSPDEPGFGASQNIFPLDRPVRFVMTKTSGTHVYYEVYGASSNDIILCNKTEENVFEIEFPAPGTYSMTITAHNPLYQATVTTTVILSEPVNITSVTDDLTKAAAYQDKSFNVTFATIGTSTCLVVDFNDGNVDMYGDASMCTGSPYTGIYRGNISSLEFTIVHQFTSTGTFFVSVHGFNDYSSSMKNLTLVISTVDCTKPRIGIKDQAQQFYNARSHLKSQQLRVIGITDINCASTLSNTKWWSVVEVDSNTGDDIRTIDISANPTSHNAELSMDKLFLDYGVYRITYFMSMNSAAFTSGEAFASEVSTYIRVVKSDIVVKVFSGGVTKIRKGHETTVTLSPGSNSYDPDLDSTQTQTFTKFIWKCRKITETHPTDNGNISVPYTVSQLQGGVPDYGGCFRNGPGDIDPTVAGFSLTFNTANMHVGETYEFNVKGYKDTRESETNVYLEIVAGKPPEVLIGCSPSTLCKPRAEGQLFRPDAKLRLLGDCISGCTTLTTYRWELYTANHQWPDGWKLVEDLNSESEGINSPQIVIYSTLFAKYPTVTSYQVRFYSIQPGGATGMSAMDLLVNTPPSGGNCSISPLSGTALQTSFSIEFNGWQDSDGIEGYQTYCVFKDDPLIKQVRYGVETKFSVKLPMGANYDDYYEDCYARIQDTLGAGTVCSLGRIKVGPLPIAYIKANISAMKTEMQDDLDKAIARGDVTELAAQALMLSGIINLASKNSQIEYQGLGIASSQTATGITADYENRTGAFETTTTNKELEEKYENEREDSSQVVISIVEAMKNVSITTMDYVSVVASALSEVVKYPEVCARPCQEGIQTVGANMISTFNKLSDDSTVEELKAPAQALMQFIGSAREAGFLNMKHPGKGDLQRTKDQNPVYDTDYESSQKGIPSGSDDPEDVSKAFYTNANEEFQIVTSQQFEPFSDYAENTLLKVFQRAMVPAEKPVVLEGNKMMISYEKNHVNKLSNKVVDLGDGGVTFPSDFCSLLASCSSDQTVMIQGKVTSFLPNSYSNGAADLSPNSGSVDIQAFDDNGNAIKIGNGNADAKLIIKIPLDKNMPIENAEYMVPFIPQRENEYFFYNSYEMSTSCGSAQLQFRLDDESLQFLAVIRFGDHPDVSTREFDSVCMIPNDFSLAGFHGNATHPDPYTCFVSTNTIGGFKGKVYVGLRQMTISERDGYPNNDSIPTTLEKTDFNTNYTIKIMEACCKWWDPSVNDWSCEGCVVSNMTTSAHVVCACNHATAFAGGWAVVPNTIDWNFVFSNADFFKNPTLYITEIIIALVYLISVIWARRQDKKDIEKLGLAPLKDNDPRDKYYYEIVVVTGMRRNAGTESKVHFILSGELEETEVRSLTDEKRKIFQRGNVDGFLMACPRQLGNLNYLRIWHDNSGKGKFASWYMRSFVVRDVQTDEKFIFISNRWFAVEEDDGQVDRVIPVAGKEQMTEFSHLFTERTTKSLSDGHLWFSVVARPPQSRFTRVQRVSCCLCLLYMTMLTNAMWYGQQTESANALTFGPFALTTEQIFIGVASNLIVFPINFLIILLFRKSRPRKKRPSRVEEALHHKSRSATSMTDVNPTIKSGSNSTPVTSSQLLEGNQRPDTSCSRPGTSMSIVDVAKTNGKKKKKKLELPWWVTIIAWILLFLATLVSAAFVTFYGISFQDVKCKKWITSLLISFFSSVFITQPIKVFLVAIFFSLIVKNPGSGDDEDEDDEEKPKLSSDEDYLHERNDTFGVARPRKVGYKPPDPRQLERAREERMKEIKMWAIVREIVFYAFFLWILLVISYRNRSYNMFLYKASMERVFIITNETSQWFVKMKNKDEFWNWASTGLVNGIRAGTYYNADPPLLMRGYINDKQSRLMGYATMRQVRIQKDTCRIPDPVKNVILECNSEYTMDQEDKGSYQIGWKPLTGNASADVTREEYQYKQASELDGYPYWGEMAVYSGGGYVVRLKGNMTVLRNKMLQLRDEGWIDRYTRAVFVEFTTMNPGINLFSVSMLLSEFRPSGGIFPSYRFEPAMLLPYMNSAMLFQLACEIIYLIFIVIFLVKEARAIYRDRCAYFKEFWNLVELAIIFMSVSATVIYFYRLFEVNKLTERFRISHGNEYMKFQYVGYWSEMMSYMIGWLVFLASLKFLKLLRFNKRMSLLASTLKASCKDLMHFSIIFNIVFLAFIQVFYLIYVANIKDFKTFISSVESGIVMMMGKFDIYEMIMVDPVITQICLFFYVLTITFIIVNMFLSILNETFGAVRVDNTKQCNDYEIVEFMMNRFKMWTGFGTPNTRSWNPNDNQAETVEGKIDDFPDRIDQLLNSISQMYMEKDRLDSLFEKNTENILMKKSHPAYTHSPHRGSIYEQPFKKGLTTVQTN